LYVGAALPINQGNVNLHYSILALYIHHDPRSILRSSSILGDWGYTAMPAGAITICKFVGTISLGLLTVCPATPPMSPPRLIVDAPIPSSLLFGPHLYWHDHLGVSTTLTTLSLPALLTLPTATNARTTLSYLTTRNAKLSSYLRYITTFSLFSAYLLSPRRFRHPYLLYTSLFTFASGPAVDLAIGVGQKDAMNGVEEVDLEAQGEEVNGEQVRQKVERLQVVESVRAGVTGLAFAMGVVGLWGDGA
jgi:autophagy-related protein 33